MKRSIEEKLLNPKPESKAAAAAKKFGIDLTLLIGTLTLLIGTLRLTPHQRVKNLQEAMISLEKLSRDAENWRKKNRDRHRTDT